MNGSIIEIGELPPAGTTLTATYRGQAHTAVIVEAKDVPTGRGQG
jgi:hypothetical protein